MNRGSSAFRQADILAIAGLFLFHLVCFGPASAVHGPDEIYDQDSVYILESLARGVPYPWNSQNHLLYHAVVETGFEGWKRVFGAGLDSAYLYLKLFTALGGLVFFIVLRRVLCELGLAARSRALWLVLTGVSVTIWFHCSAFETHITALPALALYLWTLVRLRDRERRTVWDRVALIGSLLVCGWSRIDLFRFAAFSAPLPLLRGARRNWRSLVVDLTLVAALGVGGNVLMASAYYGYSWSYSARTMLERDDRPDLARRLRKSENLSPHHLAAVARGVTIYSVLAPIERRPPHRSFWAPPSYQRDQPLLVNGVEQDTGLYREPVTNLMGNALSALAFMGVVGLLGMAAVAGVRRIIAGDLLHAMIAIHAASGWILYTWFNPHEPFLWAVEYVPLWIVALADTKRMRAGRDWIFPGAVTALVFAHNWFAFHLPFRG